MKMASFVNPLTSLNIFHMVRIETLVCLMYNYVSRLGSNVLKNYVFRRNYYMLYEAHMSM
jgi:hypothetical protein